MLVYISINIYSVVVLDYRRIQYTFIRMHNVKIIHLLLLGWNWKLL